MARKLKHDIPGTDFRVALEVAAERGWAAVFGDDAPASRELVVEIGFGRGEFLLDLAASRPETAFVGIEVSAKRNLKMARRLARSELRNLRLAPGRAEDVLAETLSDGMVREFWLNFPDPWPKKRHWRRRFVQPDTVALLARLLAPGGVLHVATDHPGYAEWIDEHLRVEPLLRNLHAPAPWRSEPPPGRKATAYELEWRALGREFHFFEYERA